MEKGDLLILGITNRHLPESLAKEIINIHNRIDELENLKLWLINYPSSFNVRSKISSVIEKARRGVKVVDTYYPKNTEEITESAFLRELKEYSSDLWNLKIFFDYKSN